MLNVIACRGTEKFNCQSWKRFILIVLQTRLWSQETTTESKVILFR